MPARYEQLRVLRKSLEYSQKFCGNKSIVVDSGLSVQSECDYEVEMVAGKILEGDTLLTQSTSTYAIMVAILA